MNTDYERNFRSDFINPRVSLTIYVLLDVNKSPGSEVFIYDEEFYESVDDKHKTVTHIPVLDKSKMVLFLGMREDDIRSWSYGQDFAIMTDYYGNDHYIYEKDYEQCSEIFTEYGINAQEIFTLSFQPDAETLKDFKIYSMDDLVSAGYMESWYDNPDDLPEKLFDFVELDDYDDPNVVFSLSLGYG